MTRKRRMKPCAECGGPIRADGRLAICRRCRADRDARAVVARWPERVWSRVDSSAGPDACWPWTGSTHTNGYGQTTRPFGASISAHRAVWELTKGPIPDGMYVCHRCDNPPCVNPAHLFLGTAHDNNADMHAKGRWSRWRRGCLSPDQVRELRRLYASGIGSTTLGRMFNMDASSALDAAKGRTFKHIEMPQ